MPAVNAPASWYTADLPEPVGLTSSVSRPASTLSTARRWISVNVIPNRRRPSRTAADLPDTLAVTAPPSPRGATPWRSPGRKKPFLRSRPTGAAGDDVADAVGQGHRRTEKEVAGGTLGRQ